MSSAGRNHEWIGHGFGGRRPRGRGIALIWFAILFIVLIGFAGIALDAGRVYLTVHQLQNAADASALAGAAKVKFNQNQAKTDAVNTATANRAAGANVQLDVAASDVLVGNYNRGSGVFSANTSPYNACRVLARRTTGSPGGPVSLFFAPIFGALFNTNMDTSEISRTATAMTGGTFSAGMIVLDPTRKSSLGAVGTSDLEITNGGIQVNSSDNVAVSLKGTADVNATELRIVGGDNTTGGSSIPATTYTGATAVDDPLKNLPIPTKGTDLGAVNVNAGETVNLVPGYYSGGITMNSKFSTLNLAPGVYILGPPGLNINGGVLSATGVMFFLTTGSDPNTYGTINLAGNEAVNISPPTSGVYKGVSVFQDPATPYNKASAVITGTAAMNLQGTIYLPSINLDMKGTSDNFANQIIVDTINIAGTGTLKINYDGRNPVEINNVFLVN